MARRTPQVIANALVSSKSASAASISGAAARPESRRSRSARSARIGATSRPSSAARRCARIRTSAVTNSLAFADGAITVPISRPSSTAPPSCPAKARCRSSSAARTSGIAETSEAHRAASSVRIAGSSNQRESKRRAATSALLTLRDSLTLQPTARYNSPVSRCGSAKCTASAREIVPLPEAAGPSTAITSLCTIGPGYKPRVRPATLGNRS